jgi:two-component system response regulator HydG
MTPKRHVLLVDDDPAMREMLASLFEAKGYRTTPAASVDVALALCAENDFDAVLSDIRMPGRSGIDLVGELHRLRPETPVVLMTAFGSVDSAVSALRAGARDYVTKPFEPDTVLLAIERALEHRHLEEENRELRRALDRTRSLGDLVGASPAMRDIFALIRRVAGSHANVLITGESGTGKDVVARALHYYGAGQNKPFVPINCTAIPEGLLESELFGHARGAFTGATSSHRGLFEKANGGSIFLDEIGDLPPALQAKLLRVLQDREVRPVGSTQSVKVDVRVIAATNQDLERAVREGRFREDLFYRLNVIRIQIPPLRERPEDIPLLAEAFLRRRDPKRRLSQPALERLRAHPWRGNARELENALERALAMTESDVIRADDLALDGEEPTASSPERLLQSAADRHLTLDELCDRYIDQILAETGGNKVRAARILGVDRKTLYRRAERRHAREGSGKSEPTEPAPLAAAPR